MCWQHFLAKVGEVHGSATKSMNKNRQNSDTDNSATRSKRCKR
jgi:hypothetical protein